MQLTKYLGKSFGFSRGCCFGKFDLDQFMRNAVFIDNIDDLVDDLRRSDVQLRKIRRNPDRLQSRIKP